MSDVQKSQLIELNDLKDLIRLSVCRMDRGRGVYLYYTVSDGKHVYFTNQLIPGWYDLRGLPITMFATTENAPETNLIEYRSASDNEEEKWQFVEFIRTGPNQAYIPIIHLKSVPAFLL